ncbi:VOC family protein [Aliikangiella sp. IMCC44632]
MAKVLGLGGVFFKSPDPQALAKWYQKWLGMGLAHPYGLTFAANDIPKNGFNIWTPFKQSSDYFSPSEKDFMFNLIVDNLDEMLTQLKPSGCHILDTIERSEYGSFGWFIDPDGNKVELWQPPQNPPSEN